MKTAIVFMFLIVDSGTSTLKRATPYQSYADCFAALAEMRIDNSDGAENERAVVAWCGTSTLQQYNDGSWKP